MTDASLPKICVLFPGALGDFICFLPALEVLGKGGAVDLFCRTEFAGLAPPEVKVRSLECFELRRLFVPGALDDERLHEFFSSYAAVHSWTGSRVSEFVEQIASVSRGRAHVYPFCADHRKLHQSDYYLSCLNAPVDPPHLPAISLQPQAVAWSEQYWRQQSFDGKPVLALAPGSGAREKNWPAAFFRDVAGWWQNRTHGAVVVVLGPVEEERARLEPLLEGCIVARGLKLEQLAALLLRSDLYLGNDSGITHVAAAVGVRTVVMFGPSDADQWAPRGNRITILSLNVDCSPCEISVMKSCPHRKCLTELYPKNIVQELQKLPEVANLTRGSAEIRV
jgi:ADP-heptose:LPS heptosyltransferase